MITSQRLHNQHLSRQVLNDPGDIIRHLGAVQAQEYAHAKWALGMRSLSLTDSDIEQAFASGAILRTHVMRPTWHFVARDDIRWMLDLTGPRVHAANSHYYKQSELSKETLARSTYHIEGALRNNSYLTRKELLEVVEQHNIPAGNTIRASYIMMYAELEGVICSGPRRGNQFTYALVSERAPAARTLDRDEALATLVKRYFCSHGPAGVADFVWWSGLTVADARRGLELNKSSLESISIDDLTYWLPSFDREERIVDASETAYLLPIYDEYGNAYRNRDDLADPSYDEQVKAGNLPAVPFQCQVVVGGKVLGSWKRTLTKAEALLEAYYYRPLTGAEAGALNRDLVRYGNFLGLAPTLRGRVL